MTEKPASERIMTDIHMHLIPGVDDGALDLDMALCMMLQAYEQGVRAIFATPHSSAFAADGALVRQQFSRLRERAAFLLPQMQLYAGCEVYCRSGQMDRVLSDLDSGCFPTMNGTKYVLTEFSPWTDAQQALFCAEALVQGGWIPILAHLERYDALCFDRRTADRFRQLGCLIQINAYSLQDEKDDSIKDWARQLVKERKADFLGTDAHRTWHRPPEAKNGLKWLYENVERGYADAIAWENASEYFDMY